MGIMGWDRVRSGMEYIWAKERCKWIRARGLGITKV